MNVIKNSNYITIKKAAEMLNVSMDTMRLWDKSGRLSPTLRGDNGYRYYTLSQISDFKKDSELKQRQKRPILYVRYFNEKDIDSKNKQLSVLTNYAKNMAIYKYNIVEVMADNRNQELTEITKLIDMIVSGKTNHIIAESDYVISPNSFNIIKHIANLYGCEITTVF